MARSTRQTKPAPKKPAQKKPARKKPARKNPARKNPARKNPARKNPVGLDFSRALSIIRKLYTQHPGADTELDYKTPFELLTATILSAQSTDAGVNRATPALFKRYSNAAALAKATAEDIEPLIHSTGFYRAKAKSLLGMARALVEQHNGEVPKTMEALVELPGVGRKTANVVLGHALGVPGLPVDRHVLRVSNRIGIASSEEPEEVEQQLSSALPPAEWTRASDTLILHGRRICKPKPLCEQCLVRDDCDFYRTLVAGPKKKVRRSG